MSHRQLISPVLTSLYCVSKYTPNIQYFCYKGNVRMMGNTWNRYFRTGGLRARHTMVKSCDEWPYRIGRKRPSRIFTQGWLTDSMQPESKGTGLYTVLLTGCKKNFPLIRLLWNGKSTVKHEKCHKVSWGLQKSLAEQRAETNSYGACASQDILQRDMLWPLSRTIRHRHFTIKLSFTSMEKSHNHPVDASIISTQTSENTCIPMHANYTWNSHVLNQHAWHTLSSFINDYISDSCRQFHRALITCYYVPYRASLQASRTTTVTGEQQNHPQMSSLLSPKLRHWS